MPTEPIDWAAQRDIVRRRTPGKWEFWTGCSWRRFGIAGTLKTVICPTNHRVDNHPDLSMEHDDGHAVVAAVNHFEAAATAAMERDELRERCKRSDELLREMVICTDTLRKEHSPLLEKLAFNGCKIETLERDNEEIRRQRDELLAAIAPYLEFPTMTTSRQLKEIVKAMKGGDL